MVKIYENNYRIMSENDDLGSNGMIDDEYIDDRINFYNNCYKLLKNLKRYNNAYHDLGIVDGDYVDYIYSCLPKKQINASRIGTFCSTNLFNTDYKFVYVDDESGCFILDNVDIASDFADDLEQFEKKINIYYKHLNADITDITTLNADIYPYGIDINTKPVFKYKNTEIFVDTVDELGVTFLYELNTDTKNGVLYLHENNKEEFLKWCNDFEIPF